MNEKDFLEKMAEIMDLEDEVTMDSVLGNLGAWDSLSMVSFIAMASTYCGRKISPIEIRKAEKIVDLYNLIR